MPINLRDASKKQYTTQCENATVAEIDCGSLQRIADAVEKMALRYTELIDKADRSESSAKYWRSESEHKDRQLSAYKGQVTRLRKKMAEINAAYEAARGAT